MSWKSLLGICLMFVVVMSRKTAFAAEQLAAPPARKSNCDSFRPAGLSIGMAVTEKANGSCFTSSSASASRPDAWRCSSGNGILDPCYQRILGDEKQTCLPSGRAVARERGAVDLDAAAPDRAAQGDQPRRYPTLGARTGQRPTLHADDGRDAAGRRHAHQLWMSGGVQVVGDIDRSEPLWRVFFQGEKSIALEQVDIAVAWF